MVKDDAKKAKYLEFLTGYIDNLKSLKVEYVFLKNRIKAQKEEYRQYFDHEIDFEKSLEEIEASV